jgi:hypothetical protein
MRFIVWFFGIVWYIFGNLLFSYESWWCSIIGGVGGDM